MAEQIECEKHGLQNEAYVCSHIVASLNEGKASGLIWSRDDDGAINAYCTECSQSLAAAGGEWTEELQDAAGISIVCEACLKPAFRLNAIPEPA